MLAQASHRRRPTLVVDMKCERAVEGDEHPVAPSGETEERERGGRAGEASEKAILIEKRPPDFHVLGARRWLHRDASGSGESTVDRLETRVSEPDGRRTRWTPRIPSGLSTLDC